MQSREGDYRRLADAVADPTWVFDIETNELVFITGRTAELCGFEPEELAALPLASLSDAHAYFARVIDDRVAAFHAGVRSPHRDDVVMPRKGGGQVWVEITSRLAVDETTGHLVLAGKMRSCDAGRLELLETMEQMAKIGAWTFEPHTGKGHWTREVSHIHDLPAEFQPSAQAGIDFYTADSKPRIDAAVRAAIADGTPYDLELELVSATGRRKWIRTIGQPFSENGNVLRVSGTIQDISRQKTIELELERERARLRTLLDTLPDLVFLKDADGRFLDCNTKFERLLGAPRSEIVGKRDIDYVPTEQAEEFRRHDRAALEKNTATKNEEELTYADGHRETVEMTKMPLRDSAGNCIGVLGIGRDITATRAAEQQLRVASKMEAVGRLAGGIAHDFNNLLTVVISCADVVSAGLPNEFAELREDCAQIISAGRRAESLTRQLLAFSRRQVLQAESLRLDQVVSHVSEMLRRLIGEDIDLRLRTRVVALAKLDRGQIEQVIMNLVVNARDAMPNGGTITIGCTDIVLDETKARAHSIPPGAYIELSVEDDGSGIDAATLPRIFEPFFSTKEPGKGTGLGLAMAYGIVRQSGGAITVASEVGRGTRFAIFVPVDANANVPDVEPPRSRRRPFGDSAGHETILVVEDEDRLRRVVKRILESAGYRVLVAANGHEALALAMAEADRIGLVVSDVVMPKMSGSELAERLAITHPNVPVLFTSGYTDEKIARHGVGSHHFLAKPFRPDQLTEVVRGLLDA